MKNLAFIFLLIMFATANFAAAESKKIVKWVDKNGVTQYGDKLPASEAGRNSSEMNTQGMTVKKNVAADKSNGALDQQKLDQERKDKILLASYTKPEEIDLARDRNLQMDQATLQSLISQKESIAARTARNNNTAEGFKARKKPIPAYLSDELKLAKSELVNVEKQLTQRKLSMQATKSRYAEEKARFIALKQPAQSTTSPANIDAASSAVVDDSPVKDITSTNVTKPNSVPAPVSSKK